MMTSTRKTVSYCVLGLILFVVLFGHCTSCNQGLKPVCYSALYEKDADYKRLWGWQSGPVVYTVLQNPGKENYLYLCSECSSNLLVNSVDVYWLNWSFWERKDHPFKQVHLSCVQILLHQHWFRTVHRCFFVHTNCGSLVYVLRFQWKKETFQTI